MRLLRTRSGGRLANAIATIALTAAAFVLPAKAGNDANAAEKTSDVAQRIVLHAL